MGHSTRVIKIKGKVTKKQRKKLAEQQAWCRFSVLNFKCVIIELLQMKEGRRTTGHVCRGLTDHVSLLLGLNYHRRIQFVAGSRWRIFLYFTL